MQLTKSETVSEAHGNEGSCTNSWVRASLRPLKMPGLAVQGGQVGLPVPWVASGMELGQLLPHPSSLQGVCVWHHLHPNKTSAVRKLLLQV